MKVSCYHMYHVKILSKEKCKTMAAYHLRQLKTTAVCTQSHSSATAALTGASSVSSQQAGGGRVLFTCLKTTKKEIKKSHGAPVRGTTWCSSSTRWSDSLHLRAVVTTAGMKGRCWLTVQEFSLAINFKSTARNDSPEMHSVEGGFFLSSEWEGGKISWQEKVRTYFSRYHLSCTRIFSCCQGVADIWQPLFFKLSFFCSNGLPQAPLKKGRVFTLRWARSVALVRQISPSCSHQQQRSHHPAANTQKCYVQKSEAAHRWVSLAVGLMCATIKGLLSFTCPVTWSANYTKEYDGDLFLMH